MKDPAQRAVYEEAALRSGKPIFSLTVHDFFHGPEVHDIVLKAYNGAAGDAISIAAEDDIEVVEVVVMVTDADGTLIEEGPASKEVNGWWIYTTTEAVAPGTALRIAATATDRPGNTHTLEKETTL